MSFSSRRYEMLNYPWPDIWHEIYAVLNPNACMLFIPNIRPHRTMVIIYLHSAFQKKT